MDFKKVSLAVLAFGVVAGASAQTASLNNYPSLSFARNPDRSTWQTIMLISIGVGVLGLANGDSTLTILGAAGAAISLSQMGRLSFQNKGFSLASKGPLSFGLNPMGMHEIGMNRPMVFLNAKFKF
jgi:hypothetical protein